MFWTPTSTDCLKTLHIISSYKHISFTPLDRIPTILFIVTHDDYAEHHTTIHLLSGPGSLLSVYGVQRVASSSLPGPTILETQ